MTTSSAPPPCLSVPQVVVCPSKFDPDMVKTMLQRLDWPVLLKVFSQLGRDQPLLSFFYGRRVKRVITPFVAVWLRGMYVTDCGTRPPLIRLVAPLHRWILTNTLFFIFSSSAAWSVFHQLPLDWVLHFFPRSRRYKHTNLLVKLLVNFRSLLTRRDRARKDAHAFFATSCTVVLCVIFVLILDRGR